MPLPNPQRSRMVVIGTSLYTDEKLRDLPVVARTVADLTAAFTDPAYGIVPESHCTELMNEGDIRRIGTQLLSAAKQAKDLLLVYYIGHGLVGSRRHDLYLALPDSEWGEPEFNALEYDKLRSAVLNSRAATKVIILDCCFSGRVVTETMADPVGKIIGQIEVDGTYVLTSAQRDQVALILPGEEHTAFTGRFLRLLQSGIPGGPELLTIHDLYLRLVDTMKAEGLPQPQKRATHTADLLALAQNRAFTASPLREHQAIALREPVIAGGTPPAQPDAIIRVPRTESRREQASEITKAYEQVEREKAEEQARRRRETQLRHNASRVARALKDHGVTPTELWPDTSRGSDDGDGLRMGNFIDGPVRGWLIHQQRFAPPSTYGEGLTIRYQLGGYQLGDDGKIYKNATPIEHPSNAEMDEIKWYLAYYGAKKGLDRELFSNDDT